MKLLSFGSVEVYRTFKAFCLLLCSVRNTLTFLINDPKAAVDIRNMSAISLIFALRAHHKHRRDTQPWDEFFGEKGSMMLNHSTDVFAVSSSCNKKVNMAVVKEV